jgi:site-specific DNA recombinase
VSLQEQRSEIERYAAQRSLNIVEWLEERETAARSGRRVFADMMKRLRWGDASGVIIHKIDRSARNLRDWADIAELTDAGIEVHFTRESFDMTSSSGRLAADVQAVVAANYVRNLREETIKGFYGRLKQGILPMPAPLGYLNAGGGKPKQVDPNRGPLIQDAFRLYATGHFSLQSLCSEMQKRGLTAKNGRPISLNTLNDLLRNPFYYGLIRIRKGNQSFAGVHQPLVSLSLFQEVQDVMAGRRVRAGSRAGIRKLYRFSRLIRCNGCHRSLVGELQKGHVYYRCHTDTCPKITFREEEISKEADQTMAPLRLHPVELDLLDKYVAEKRAQQGVLGRRHIIQLELKLSEVKSRLSRLTDVYIDGQIDGQAFNERKTTLLSERLETEQKLAELSRDSSTALAQMEKYVELVKHAYLLYETGNDDQKRRLLEMTMSNRGASEKTLRFTLKSELSDVVSRPRVRTGGPSRRICRTFWRGWIDRLCESTGDQPDERVTARVSFVAAKRRQ